jgi:predicted DNA-binding transcriptional regulator AlpA
VGKKVIVMNVDRLLKDKECCEVLNVSRATWWNGVKKGIFPQPIKLTERTTRWRLSEVLALIENGEG